MADLGKTAWSTGRWALGVIGALIMLATQVSPETATSNIAGWAAKIGFPSLAYLPSSVDQWALGAGFLLIVIALASYLVVRATHGRMTAVLPVGSLQFVQFCPQIQRKVTTNKASVQPAVDLKNTSTSLLKLYVRLKGAANAVSGYPLEIAFETFIHPGETKKLLYQRLEDVALNDTPALGRPSLSGGMDYDIEYWTPEKPSVKRRTARRCIFEIRQPLNKTPPEPGTMRKEQYEIHVSFQNEVEG